MRQSMIAASVITCKRYRISAIDTARKFLDAVSKSRSVRAFVYREQSIAQPLRDDDRAYDRAAIAIGKKNFSPFILRKVPVKASAFVGRNNPMTTNGYRADAP